MSEQEKNVLFDVHGDLVCIETCIKQLGKVCNELATPSTNENREEILYFIGLSLGMYADRLSKAEEQLDNVIINM